ncbi:MAG: activator of (R)-2-hydroxyglutaryl-CoA dehydratase [Spirochaetia bacterium]|nr:activator of (R)-2-hydroxyglutaryl-CoA dehydratase [Spirochaetia bacterium]
MLTNSTIHFKRAQERAFPKSRRNSTTILFGGLSTLADRFIESSMIGLGYLAKALPVPDMDAMSAGKEYCDTGLCNPTYFTVGNLLMYLEKLRDSGLEKEEIINNYVFITAGSCGPCRFGMYEYEYQYALENAGFGGFRVIIFQMAGSLNQGDLNSGLRMDFEFFRAILNSVILSDHLNELRYQIKPYEVEKGSTEAAIEECAAKISNYLRTKKPLRDLSEGSSNIKFEKIKNIYDQLFQKKLKKVLLECRIRINEVLVDYHRIKPVVKITGEFWAQSTEGDGNYKMFQFLEEEGCEIIIESVSAWVVYLLWLSKLEFNEKSMTNKQGRITFKKPAEFIRALYQKMLRNLAISAGTLIYKNEYRKTGKLLGGKFRPLKSVQHLAKLASPYMDIKYDGGEGFLEVAKNIYFTKNNIAHMVLSIKPFGCMPSTISDSIQVKVMTDFDQMIFLPLETSGEGKINALSRVQMALSEARNRAVREYESAIENNHLFQSIDTRNNGYMRALDKLPQIKGTALKAVNYLTFLAKARA